MAENGWTQGVCQEEPGFPRLLINSLERLGVTERPRYYSREYEHLGTLCCRVVLSIARSTRHPDIEPWRVTATGFQHRDAYPLAIRKALRYLCRIFEEHLIPTPMRLFPPAIRMNLERRRHQEDLLYHVVAYLISLDKLFDEQARFLREQTHRAEQDELAVRMHQIRVAQAKARTAAAISSEAVAHENLRQIQDRRMQEWTSSGTPVPAVGETQVLIGTPVVGWGGLFGTLQAPPEGAERSAVAVEEGAVEQPRENGILEDDEEEQLIPLEVHSAPEDDSPRE
ncbi:hypothetical protein PAHAL_7G076900 [Panicum hallii]|uniref:Uncharacterized protein n=1 Tax=Panicum hallii TaxID=206008 RepID=A0A2T8IBA8_9POAL|nr:hypothetical protein PAHAL_7G076900 [Panicum hallii]